MSETIRFKIVRFAKDGKKKTTINDVRRFIEENKDTMSRVVEIDSAGIGDCFADCLEQAGFTVKRIHSGGNRSSQRSLAPLV